MKNIKRIVAVFLAMSVLSSCEEKEVSYNFSGISAPSELNAIFEMNEEVLGEISVTPTGNDVGSFYLFFGDVEDEAATIVAPGETVTHTYEEGEYVLRVVGTGVTGLTSELSRIISVGSDTVVTPPDPEVTEPETSAPAPTVAEANVISIFSDDYTNLALSEVNPDWGQTTVLEIVEIQGNEVYKYTDLNFTGIVTNYDAPTDLSGMTTVHFDYWTVDAESLSFKMVNTTQPDGDPLKEDIESVGDISTGEWVAVDLALSAYSTDRSAITQLLFESSGATVFIDNLYFYGAGTSTTDTEPSDAAMAPIIPEADVISLFSDAYTDIAMSTWRTEWSNAALEDLAIAGNATKKYTEVDFVGIETGAPTNVVDATAMTHFHVDVWSADFTEFKVKLVDFGADGGFDGGDDVEHEIVYEAPSQGEWISYDLPLSEFVGLTTKEHIAQLIFAAGPTGSATIFVDNVYFYTAGGMNTPTEPSTAATTPTMPESNVISLFSDAYTAIMMSTWRTEWSNAALEDLDIAGNATKKYTELDFVGIETGAPANVVDASTMTHFHVDVWSSDFTEFKIKLVDFGVDGGFDGGDDVEHEIVYETPVQGEWISYDIPLSEFVGLTTKEHIAQLIFAASPTGSATIFVDNVYFHN